jgi:hypothetical protein
MALIEKRLLKDGEIAGDDGKIKLLQSLNRIIESVYSAFNNDVTFRDNLAVQIWQTGWMGDIYPSKKIDRDRVKGNPIGLLVLDSTENGTAYSMANPAWEFEIDTIKITNINGIITPNEYTGTFIIL